jgi:hypothetical protein
MLFFKNHELDFTTLRVIIIIHLQLSDYKFIKLSVCRYKSFVDSQKLVFCIDKPYFYICCHLLFGLLGLFELSFLG